MAIPIRPFGVSIIRSERRVKVATGRGSLRLQGALLAPSTASAFAFKHADGLAAERVKYATDEIEVSVALLAPAIFPGFFACKFFAAEEVHFSPLHERGNKYQKAQIFRDQDADIQY